MTEHIPLPPFAATSGCFPGEKLRMLIIGEAWGESEAMARKPFVGASGRELFLMLGEAIPDLEPELWGEARKVFWLDAGWVRAREEWLKVTNIGMTNVLALRPQGNKIETLCVKKTDLPEKGKNYVHPPIAQGKYLLPEFYSEIQRLEEEILSLRPNLILALGNTAQWACLRTTNIGSTRGTVAETRIQEQKIKTLPTYHPAGVMRNWSWRPIVVTDLMKAWRESANAEIVRPSRQIVVNPTIEEVEEWIGQTLSNPPSLLSVDIETAKGLITCIGFARSISDSLVVPFARQFRSENGSYWGNLWEEVRAWKSVWKLLGSSVPKLFQNGMYDLQYLVKQGLRVERPDEDSMLLHHSILPEMQKGLGFLGSVYSSEPAWKLMRKRRGDDVVKADE